MISSFAPALDACGATLGTVYYDGPYTVGTKSFRNWWGEGRGYTGYHNIREGIIYSMNIIAVRCLMETVTPQLGVDYAERMGISTLTKDDLNAATALGGLTKGVTNLDITSAFASIANGGVYTKPRFFTKILDHDGNVLIDNQPETTQVLKDSTAFLLTDAMSESVKSNRLFARSGVSINSTSTAAALSGMSTAGKSGTTTNNVDIWFIGYTPYYTAGVWGGCDDNQSLSGNGGTSFHKAIWRKIMTRVHEGLSDPGFEVPDSIETVQICRKSGKLAVSGVCSADPRGNAVYTEYFAKGTAPTEVCDKHVAVTVCAESGMTPTPFCINKTTRTCMVLPEGESGTTDDSYFPFPEPVPCTPGRPPLLRIPLRNRVKTAPLPPSGRGISPPLRPRLRRLGRECHNTQKRKSPCLRPELSGLTAAFSFSIRNLSAFQFAVRNISSSSSLYSSSAARSRKSISPIGIGLTAACFVLRIRASWNGRWRTCPSMSTFQSWARAKPFT